MCLVVGVKVQVSVHTQIMLLPALSDEISSNLNLYCYHFERLLGICLFNVFLCVGAFALNLFVQALNNFEPLVSLGW